MKQIQCQALSFTLRYISKAKVQKKYSGGPCGQGSFPGSWGERAWSHPAPFLCPLSKETHRAPLLAPPPYSPLLGHQKEDEASATIVRSRARQRAKRASKRTKYQATRACLKAARLGESPGAGLGGPLTRSLTLALVRGSLRSSRRLAPHRAGWERETQTDDPGKRASHRGTGSGRTKFSCTVGRRLAIIVKIGGAL